MPGMRYTVVLDAWRHILRFSFLLERRQCLSFTNPQEAFPSAATQDGSEERQFGLEFDLIDPLNCRTACTKLPARSQGAGFRKLQI